MRRSFVVVLAAWALRCGGQDAPSSIPTASGPSGDDGIIAEAPPLIGDDAASAVTLPVASTDVLPPAIAVDDGTAGSSDGGTDADVALLVSPSDDACAADGGAEATAAPGESPVGACTDPPGPGSLMIDELMIESVSGTGDYGEWIEVKSTLDCTVNLRGLHGDCPRGAKVATFDINDDLWLPAGATFVIADSTDPAINHRLPGTLVPWFGQPGDVLRNKGTTVTLSIAGVVIDTVTYPALSLTVGASLAFPSDCDGGRGDWTVWQTSVSSWFPGFFGTPNAPNDDIQCP